MSQSRKPRVWPVQPLVDKGGFDTVVQLGHHVGMSGTAIKDARDNGLTDERADELAIRLGMHPTEVWGWHWVTEWLGLFNPEAIHAA